MINQFVERIACSREPAFIVTIDCQRDEHATATPIGRFVPDLKRMYDAVVSMEDDLLSKRQRIFLDACQDVGIEFSPLVGITCLDESESRYLSTAETTNWLVERIRSRLLSQG